MLITSAPHHGNKWNEGNSGSREYSVTFLAAMGQRDKLLEKLSIVPDAVFC